MMFGLSFGKKSNVKNLVFSILTKEYPLKLVELTNYIRSRYGKLVTFQAVRKAVLELVSGGVLIKKDSKYLINKKWLLESRKVLDTIYVDLTASKVKPSKISSIEGEVSVFTFNSLNELMKFWQDLIEDWYNNFKKGYPVNCYQGAHVWEGLLYLDREEKVIKQLKKKGIKSHMVCIGNTFLDKGIKKFYQNIGVKMDINHSSSSFDKSYYVGTYGDMIIQTTYPKKIVVALDEFFKKNKSITSIDLMQLSRIANMKVKMKLTVIKNLEMAKQINVSILG